MRQVFEPPAYDARGDGTNYWRTTTTGTEVPVLTEDETADVLVIGAGLTGLNAALELRAQGADVVLIDAQAPGFGASGRAGGFCCLGGAALDLGAILKTHGPAEAAAWVTLEKAAIAHVDRLLSRHAIDVDRHSKGETLLAHSPKAMAELRRETPKLATHLGVEPALHSQGDLEGLGLGGAGFHGGMTLPLGFAVNPLKYSLGLLRAAQAAGVRVYGQSPAKRVAPTAKGWRVETTGGTIAAERLILATNGYTPDGLLPQMDGRVLPVMSSIVVSDPIPPELQARQGWTSTQMCYDTRSLLHYFRLMPNGRMLFGMRGALKADMASLRKAQRRVRADFDRMFPAWTSVETPHFWSGFVAFTRSLTPFIGPLPGARGAFAALGYHGNGIAMGSLAGQTVARLCLGQVPEPPLPDFVTADPHPFPLGRHRRLLLTLAIPLARLKDRFS